jgi:hypothetical protein
MACVRYTQERKSVREKVTPDNAGQRRMSHFLMTRKKKGRPLAVAIGGCQFVPNLIFIGNGNLLFFFLFNPDLYPSLFIFVFFFSRSRVIGVSLVFLF